MPSPLAQRVSRSAASVQTDPHACGPKACKPHPMQAAHTPVPPWQGAGSTLLCLHFSPAAPYAVRMPPRCVGLLPAPQLEWLRDEVKALTEVGRCCLPAAARPPCYTHPTRPSQTAWLPLLSPTGGRRGLWCHRARTGAAAAGAAPAGGRCRRQQRRRRWRSGGGGRCRVPSDVDGHSGRHPRLFPGAGEHMVAAPAAVVALA